MRGAAVAGLAVGLAGPSVARGASPPNRSSVKGPLPENLMAAPVIDPTLTGEKYWAQLRKAFPLSTEYIHMNTGTTGSQPWFSLNNLAVYNVWKSQDPRDWAANLENAFPTIMRTTAERQAAIAAQFGANANEIVLSYNTSDACNLIFAGTPWKAGDRIVTTSFEHPGMVGPLAAARDYFDLDVVIIDIPTPVGPGVTAADITQLFIDELEKPLPAGAKQYVAFSEVFYKNGMRMPVKEICSAARDRGAFSIVDTAHGWGMLPIDCHDYAVDFLAGAGHKWLCGGPGTGVLYVRYSGSAPLAPWSGGNWPSYGNLFVDPSVRFNNRNWAPTAIQGRGETNTPALYAMSDSADLFFNVGIRNIYDRGVALAQYLQGKARARWGQEAVTVQSPDPAFKTFLSSINPYVGRNDPAQFSTINAAINRVLAALAAETPKIYIRSVTWHSVGNRGAADDLCAFRISTHAMYNNYAEIDWMFDRLAYHVEAQGLAVMHP